MELVEGDSLADRLRRGPIPIQESLKLAQQIAMALEAAHEKGVIHRDLKPANIKVTPDGVVKVLDFGLAKAVLAAGTNDSVTATVDATEAGVVLGTVAYMAPEQAQGKVVDKRVDIWAFGVLLYEMLTGERPFGGANANDTLAQVLTKEPDLQRLPGSARRLIAKCLEKDSRRRLRDIGDAWDRLDEAETPVAVSPSTSRLTLILAGALLAALSTLSFLYFSQKTTTEHVLRADIAAPDGASSLHSFAISPNGRAVVIAAVVNGKRQLWLRPMDALQAQPLPNTEDATYPFWSPDSSRIGFFAQGSLKKIAVSGGLPEALCTVPDARGGSWGRTDVILFGSSLGGRVLIQRVPASGGTPSVVGGTNSDYTNPTFLPDGDHFLFVNRSREGSGIYVSALDGKETRRILPDVSAAVYAPPLHARGGGGHLLFIRDNALMVQPFDDGSLRGVGEASVLVRGVPLTANKVYAPVSVSDNGDLLYQSEVVEGSAGLIYVYDRAGKIQQAIGATGDEQPNISADGKFVVFRRPQPQGLWLRDLKRGTDQVLVSDEKQRGVPVWSPAGDRIVFGIREQGIYDLYQRIVGASARDELLVKTGNSKAPTQWTSLYFVYQEFNPKTKRDIWVLPLDAGIAGTPRPFLQTDADELLGQLSPDGRWMAYTSEASGQREVYVRGFSGTGRETLISTAGGEQPRWARNSKELFFAGADGKLTVVRVNTQGASFDAGPPQALFDMHMAKTENGAQFEYDVTADGQRFVIATSVGAFASARPLTLAVNWQVGLSK
jgi:Tol biopolymer transport system component